MNASSTAPAPRFTTRALVRGAMIAAIYVALTLIFQPISFGAIQFRVAEALTLLPILTPDAVPGLFVGCLLANWLGGGIWFDVVLGSIATFLAALCTRKFRAKLPLAAFFPTLFNGLIVGPVVYFAYVRAPGAPVSIATLLFNMATVALGELAVCYALGVSMIFGLKKLPVHLFEDPVHS
ncbi:MAG: QueT transporter family protein [Clostridia bacterium]|nr:QueT transporter family protein [Clostridia bacterium]